MRDGVNAPSLFLRRKYAAELFILQHAVHALVEPRFGDRAGFHRGDNAVKCLGQYLWH